MTALRKSGEPTFATARPGELYRAPDGCLKRKPIAAPQPALSIVPKPVERPQQPRPGVPKAASLKAPLRGQKVVRRGGWLVRLTVDLAAKYPAIKQGLPLRIGIVADLVNGGLPQQTARDWLKHWTSRPEYHAAVSTAVKRFNLDGTVAGEISDKHRAYALQQLENPNGSP